MLMEEMTMVLMAMEETTMEEEMMMTLLEEKCWKWIVAMLLDRT